MPGSSLTWPPEEDPWHQPYSQRASPILSQHSSGSGTGSRTVKLPTPKRLPSLTAKAKINDSIQNLTGGGTQMGKSPDVNPMELLELLSDAFKEFSVTQRQSEDFLQNMHETLSHVKGLIGSNTNMGNTQLSNIPKQNISPISFHKALPPKLPVVPPTGPPPIPSATHPQWQILKNGDPGQYPNLGQTALLSPLFWDSPNKIKIELPNSLNLQHELTPRPSPNDGQMDWASRVAIQHQRNSDLYQRSVSAFADQQIGFNEDGFPVDKLTTPAEVWAKDCSGQLSPAPNLIQPTVNTGVIPINTHISKAGSSKGNKSERNCYHCKETPWDDKSSENYSDSDSDSEYPSSDELWAEDLIQPTQNLSASKRQKMRRKMVEGLRAKSADDDRRQRWTHQVH
ncbi:hypothetical protein GYMLUDRAFT_64536 [Collybiopsis luxurians FD-317 M1]|uniref:Uncharacterized protein n=1 Tax=Collybiopsis luxurians FD-317 M1 TaxID=944289 RepID=A0A0D0CAQ9_9AGAR|nr:hypothetical protein GYMLUDRAFT_64536 [Collybiopsis luxurians FD-317 M1]